MAVALLVELSEHKHNLPFIQEFFGFPNIPPRRVWEKTSAHTQEIWNVSQTGTQDPVPNLRKKYAQSQNSPARLRIKEIFERYPIEYKIHFFHLNHLMDVKTSQFKYYISISWVNIPQIQPQYIMKHYKRFIKEIWLSLCYMGSLIMQTRIDVLEDYLANLTLSSHFPNECQMGT
ncbi:uncharacterized protein VP01_8887g1 [Puccinia sorghi]|uniref:Uncharacterized protein n=1 Tax=Puccinia sorghi TaxID=27349 RepID=A0A0L6UAB4_9BASI|nr:uncharacterized protein VP01_8887g1 [Puccinia sorghi]